MRRCAEHLYNFVKDSKCASIAHFPLFFFTFMFSLVLSGCDKNADTPDIPEAHKEVYKMKDGLIVRVNSEINYYETEDSFFAIITPNILKFTFRTLKEILCMVMTRWIP